MYCSCREIGVWAGKEALSSRYSVDEWAIACDDGGELVEQGTDEWLKMRDETKLNCFEYVDTAQRYRYWGWSHPVRILCSTCGWSSWSTTRDDDGPQACSLCVASTSISCAEPLSWKTAPSSSTGSTTIVGSTLSSFPDFDVERGVVNVLGFFALFWDAGRINAFTKPGKVGIFVFAFAALCSTFCRCCLSALFLEEGLSSPLTLVLVSLSLPLLCISPSPLPKLRANPRFLLVGVVRPTAAATVWDCVWECPRWLDDRPAPPLLLATEAVMLLQCAAVASSVCFQWGNLSAILLFLSLSRLKWFSPWTH